MSAHRQADATRLAEFGVKAINAAGTPDSALLAQLGSRVAAGELRVPISGTYSLEQAVQATARIRNRHVRGTYAVGASEPSAGSGATAQHPAAAANRRSVSAP